MEYTLLDAIMSKDKKRDDSGSVKFISLPRGVKQLFYNRSLFLVKEWSVVFEGSWDIEAFTSICEEKHYIVIDAVQLESERGGAEDGIKDLFNFIGGTRGEPRLGDRMLAQFEPDIVYLVYQNRRYYEGRRRIAYVSYYERTQKLWFRTSRRKGLELVEAYRKSLMNT